MHARIFSTQKRNGINREKVKCCFLPWMDLYGCLGQPVLLCLFVNMSSLINIMILFGRNNVVLLFLLLFEKPTSLNTFFHGHATYYALLHSVFAKLMQHWMWWRKLSTRAWPNDTHDCLTNFQCYAVEGCSSLWLLTSCFAKREILLFEQNVYSQKSLVWLCYSACLRATRDWFLKTTFCTHLLGPWCSCPSVVFVTAWTKSRWVCWSSDPLSVVQQSPGHQIECWEHAL